MKCRMIPCDNDVNTSNHDLCDKHQDDCYPTKEYTRLFDEYVERELRIRKIDKPSSDLVRLLVKQFNELIK
jgi:hypothetical protein